MTQQRLALQEYLSDLSLYGDLVRERVRILSRPDAVLEPTNEAAQDLKATPGR